MDDEENCRGCLMVASHEGVYAVCLVGDAGEEAVIDNMSLKGLTDFRDSISNYILSRGVLQ